MTDGWVRQLLTCPMVQFTYKLHIRESCVVGANSPTRYRCCNPLQHAKPFRVKGLGESFVVGISGLSYPLPPPCNPLHHAKPYDARWRGADACIATACI